MKFQYSKCSADISSTPNGNGTPQRGKVFTIIYVCFFI